MNLTRLALALCLCAMGCQPPHRGAANDTEDASTGVDAAAGDADAEDAFVCCDPSCARTKPLGCNECFCSGGQWVCSTFGCGPELTQDASRADASDGGPTDAGTAGEGGRRDAGDVDGD